ncbi:MAG: hypothetical protein ABIA21_02215 [Candidatus Aenigmatarchaeota archaeon]
MKEGMDFATVMDILEQSVGWDDHTLRRCSKKFLMIRSVYIAKKMSVESIELNNRLGE